MDLLKLLELSLHFLVLSELLIKLLISILDLLLANFETLFGGINLILNLLILRISLGSMSLDDFDVLGNLNLGLLERSIFIGLVVSLEFLDILFLDSTDGLLDRGSLTSGGIDRSISLGLAFLNSCWL